MTEKKEELNRKLSLTEAAELGRVSRQAFYTAIKKGTLKAHMENNRWFIYERDVDEYRAHKYSRERSTFNGKPLFNPEEKEISVKQAAKLLGFNEQKFYYLIRIGKVPVIKRGGSLIISYEDALKLATEPKEEKQLKFA